MQTIGAIIFMYIDLYSFICRLWAVIRSYTPTKYLIVVDAVMVWVQPVNSELQIIQKITVDMVQRTYFWIELKAMVEMENMLYLP